MNQTFVKHILVPQIHPQHSKQQSTSPPKSPEVYLKATGIADKQPKPNSNDNKSQPPTTDVQDSTMPDDDQRPHKYPSDTEPPESVEDNPTNKVGCHTLTTQIN